MSFRHFGLDPRIINRNTAENTPSPPPIPSPSPPRHGLSPPQKNPYCHTPQPLLSRSIQTPGSNVVRLQIKPLPAISGNPNLPPIIKKTPPQDKYETFDSMIASLKNYPLYYALSTYLQEFYPSSSITVYVKKDEDLYSYDTNSGIKLDQGIVGISASEKIVVSHDNPTTHDSYDSTIDMDKPTLMIPLITKKEELIALVRCNKEESFNEDEISLAQFIYKKFSQYAHFVVENIREYSLMQDSLVGGDMAEVLKKITEKITHDFQARTCEFYLLDADKEEEKVSRLNIETTEFEPVEKPGAVEILLKDKQTVSVNNVKTVPYYNEEADGTANEAFIAVPSVSGSKIFAIVLRGKGYNQAFGIVDEQHLQHLIPIFTRTLASDVIEDGTSEFALRLTALLEVAEKLSGVLDIDSLIPLIMDKACALLNTERCSLFLVNTTKQELKTRFHGGLEKAISLPMNKGIAGHTAATGKIVNITDAYNDPRFDKDIDMETGYKTKTILSVPIYNNRGEIAGVTEMINRKDGSEFDTDDIKMMMAFNVFCGISLDNAKLYQTSLDLTRQLRGFVEASNLLNKTKTIRDAILEILSNAMEAIHATSASVHVYNNDTKELAPFALVGAEIIDAQGYSLKVIETKKAEIFSLDAQPQPEAQPQPQPQSEATEVLPSTSDTHMPRIANLLKKDTDVTTSQSELNQIASVCTFPLLANDKKILGSMLLLCNWKVLPEDMKLLDCFANFASVSIEKAALQDLARFGNVESELRKLISESERQSVEVPIKMMLEPKQCEIIQSVNFDAPEWAEIGYIKVVWSLFNSFDLFNEFHITNEKFFRFLTEISNSYNPVPYHNWRHAVDVTQFVTLQIRTAKLENVLPKFEVFGLLTAAICHDANHDGFTNDYNVKAQTPLGILFKNQSVMETHHCSVSIGIISKQENNIFSSLSSLEYKQMWTLIIQLILITDMAKHFDFLKAANAELDNGPLDTQKPEHRLILMQAILKCGDISNVSRPFKLADKWCDVLCEEFFRQGDLEMAQGMEYTSPLNDREHLDKPKSQIGFYTFVCLPLFQLAARAAPPLKCNVDQIESNLAVWKAAAAAKAAGVAKASLDEEKKKEEEEPEDKTPPPAPGEPKAEEPPAEEPKTEETPAEEPKAEETPAEETKVEEPKTAEEPPVEEPKTVEEPKAEENNTETPTTEDSKIEDPPAEEIKAEEPPAEEPKTEETPAEEPKAEEQKTDDQPAPAEVTTESQPPDTSTDETKTE